MSESDEMIQSEVEMSADDAGAEHIMTGDHDFQIETDVEGEPVRMTCHCGASWSVEREM